MKTQCLALPDSDGDKRVTYHRIKLVKPVVQVSEEEQMMEMVRCVAEIQMLRAE